jgi:small subunit ribosomal protein S1
MSDQPNPTPPPPPENKPAEAQPAAQPAQQPVGEKRPLQREGRGDRGPRRERPPRDRERRESAVPFDDLTNRGPNLRELDAALQNELDAALAGFDQQALVSREEPRAAAGPAGGKKGRVIAVHGEDIFVDIPGGRSQGVISLQQFDGIPPTVGAEVDVDIDHYDAANGLLILTRRGAVQQVDWSSVAEGMVVEARVTATNKGGLSVDVNGIRGFMPISQIDLYRVEQPEQFVNQRLRAVVTEVKPEERNLVVSRRALLERERDEQREKFWSGLEVGQVRSGMVRSIQPFGAFVDLGGADGLIPIGELSWTRVNHPSDVVKEGQKVDVKVMKVDRETRKIGLSLRQLSKSPWDDLETRFYPGMVVTRKITRLMEFGAFVELEPGIEGLVHVSEVSPQRVRKPSAVVQAGQEVNVKVLSIDKENRRIALSIKQAQAAPESEPEPEEAEQEQAKPQKPRNIKLRGGVGNKWTLPEME